jgi:hypothetical protein
MRIRSVISHAIMGCVGGVGGYLVTTGHLGVLPSFAQAPAAAPGQQSTEMFNRVMEDALGRRLTVRLTEREPGNGSAAIVIPEATRSATDLEGRRSFLRGAECTPCRLALRQHNAAAQVSCDSGLGPHQTGDSPTIVIGSRARVSGRRSKRFAVCCDMGEG